jgi:hypothetical protein
MDREARLCAMKDRWNVKRHVFTCYFTGLTLNEDDWRHPLYATWEHLSPGGTDVTLAAAFVNSMKSNLSEEMFREIVRELARVWSSPRARYNSKSVPLWPWRGGRPVEVG